MKAPRAKIVGDEAADQAGCTEHKYFAGFAHALSFCWSMISAQTLRVCRKENRYPLFRIIL
jgi:hypothetical protein